MTTPTITLNRVAWFVAAACLSVIVAWTGHKLVSHETRIVGLEQVGAVNQATYERDTARARELRETHHEDWTEIVERDARLADNLKQLIEQQAQLIEQQARQSDKMERLFTDFAEWMRPDR